jgi:hypothetical protein
MNVVGELGLAGARHVSWVMADEPIEAIEEITKRIVEAIRSDAPPEDLCKLAEARAWLIWPNQPH